LRTIGKIIQYYQTALSAVSETPRLDIEILLSDILELPRAYLLAYPERELSEAQLLQLKYYTARRENQEPIAYIIGHKAFWNLDLFVSTATLIPRVETEHLVEWCLQNLPKESLLQIADLGTGSGAIALALGMARPIWQIDATDKCRAALNIAEKNRDHNQISNVDFYLGKWCEALPHKSYHVIISNPPYIAKSDPHLSDLLYEPQSALIAEENGLADLKTIISNAKNYLVPDGFLILEHGYDQNPAVTELLRAHGYKNINPARDLAGHWRYVSAQK